MTASPKYHDGFVFILSVALAGSARVREEPYRIRRRFSMSALSARMKIFPTPLWNTNVLSLMVDFTNDTIA
jgi:hypothetical protein